MRRDLFEQRLADILSHNSNPNESYKKGVNRFTDRTPEEFKRVLGVNRGMLYKSRESNERKAKALTPERLRQIIRMKQKASLAIPNINQYPNNVDWRLRNCVTAVKDQGDCGSCWSFASSEAVESHWALATGELSTLSEQQILDCTYNPLDCGGTGGCGGGTSEVAYNSIIYNQSGLSSEWTYPYLSYQGSDFTCKFSMDTTAPVAMLQSYEDLPSNEYDPVMAALAYVGPLSISVAAGDWSSYESGVYTGCKATSTIIDHGVLLVGYGVDPTYGDYWLVRNSWAPIWGEDGYIRIARSSTVTCGLDTNPSDGDGCDGGPSTVKVCGPCALLYDANFPIVVTN